MVSKIAKKVKPHFEDGDKKKRDHKRPGHDHQV